MVAGRNILKRVTETFSNDRKSNNQRRSLADLDGDPAPNAVLNGSPYRGSSGRLKARRETPPVGPCRSESKSGRGEHRSEARSESSARNESRSGSGCSSLHNLQAARDQHRCHTNSSRNSKGEPVEAADDLEEDEYSDDESEDGAGYRSRHGDSATNYHAIMMDVKRAYEKVVQDEASQQNSKWSSLVIHPDRPMRLTWDLCGMACIMYQAVTVPFSLAFATRYMHGEECLLRAMSGQAVDGCAFGVINMMVDIFFLFDILFNFFTGFYDKGTLVMTLQRCSAQYVRTWLLVDALSIIPWHWIGSDEDDSSKDIQYLKALKFLKFVRLLKLLRVMKLRSVLIKLEDHLRSEWLYFTFQMSKLGMSLLLLCHITACAWYGVGLLAMSEEDDDTDHYSWIEDARIHEANTPSGDKYIAALYFTMATMTTVGYGDISAGTYPIERAFCIVTLLMGTGAFTMLVSSIATSFRQATSSSGDSRRGAEMNRAALRYLWKLGVSGELTVQIRKYLQQHHESNEELDTEEYLRENISQSLLHHFCMETFHNIVTKFDFFKASSEEVLVEICKICRRVRTAPGEVIIIEGDEAEAMYFVLQGRVLAVRYDRNEDDPIPVITQGMYFGEACLFKETAIRQASIIARTFCELVKIDKRDFQRLAMRNEELADQIEDRKRELEKHAQRLARMGKQASGDPAHTTKCNICERVGHYPEDCPIKLKWDKAHETMLIGSSVDEEIPFFNRCLMRIPLCRCCPRRLKMAQSMHTRKRRKVQIFGVVGEKEGPKKRLRVKASVLKIMAMKPKVGNALQRRGTGMDAVLGQAAQLRKGNGADESEASDVDLGSASPAPPRHEPTQLEPVADDESNAAWSPSEDDFVSDRDRRSSDESDAEIGANKSQTMASVVSSVPAAQSSGQSAREMLLAGLATKKKLAAVAPLSTNVAGRHSEVSEMNLLEANEGESSSCAVASKRPEPASVPVFASSAAHEDEVEGEMTIPGELGDHQADNGGTFVQERSRRSESRVEID